jgi:hypothetical protein
MKAICFYCNGVIEYQNTRGNTIKDQQCPQCKHTGTGRRTVVHYDNIHNEWYYTAGTHTGKQLKINDAGTHFINRKPLKPFEIGFTALKDSFVKAKIETAQKKRDLDRLINDSS